MKQLAFLAIPVVLTAIGSTLLWLRHRRPTSLQSGIEAFHRELNALSPERRERGDGRTRGTRQSTRDDHDGRR